MARTPIKIIRTLALALLVGFSPPASAELLIGVFASPRQGELALVGGDGFGMLIANLITTGYPGAQLVGTQTLTTDFLATVDIVIVNSASGFGIGTSFSGSEQHALLDFVKGGGGAIIAADGNPASAGHLFGAPFGVSTGFDTVNDGRFTEIDHPVAKGPFGTLTIFSIDPIGDADGFFSIGPFASVIARAGLNGTGPPVVVDIPDNRISPGSGRVLLFSDAVILGWSAIANDGLILNSIEYLSQIPEASSITTVALACFAFSLKKIARRTREKAKTQIEVRLDDFPSIESHVQRCTKT